MPLSHKDKVECVSLTLAAERRKGSDRKSNVGFLGGIETSLFLYVHSSFLCHPPSGQMQVVVGFLQ